MALQQAGDVADDSLDGDAVLLKQLARVKAVVEVVIDAVAANAHVTVAQASGDLFTPSAGEDAVFQRDNNAVPIGQGRNELLVKFRGEARVDECGLDPMLSKGSYDPFAKLEEIAQGEYSSILAMLHDTVCWLGEIRRIGKIGHKVGARNGFGPRHANHDGQLALAKRPVEHKQVFLDAGWGEHAQVGQASQHGEVKIVEMRFG